MVLAGRTKTDDGRKEKVQSKPDNFAILYSAQGWCENNGTEWEDGERT